MKYEAILRHGLTYTALGQTFKNGEPSAKLITQKERDFLEREAIKVIKTTEGGRIETCAFDFVARNEAEAVAEAEDDGMTEAEKLAKLEADIEAEEAEENEDGDDNSEDDQSEEEASKEAEEARKKAVIDTARKRAAATNKTTPRKRGPAKT